MWLVRYRTPAAVARNKDAGALAVVFSGEECVLHQYKDPRFDSVPHKSVSGFLGTCCLSIVLSTRPVLHSAVVEGCVSGPRQACR